MRPRRTELPDAFYVAPFDIRKLTPEDRPAITDFYERNPDALMGFVAYIDDPTAFNEATMDTHGRRDRVASFGIFPRGRSPLGVRTALGLLHVLDTYDAVSLERTNEIVLRMDPSTRNGRHGTRITALTTQLLLAANPDTPVTINTRTDNTAAIKIATRLGFEAMYESPIHGGSIVFQMTAGDVLRIPDALRLGKTPTLEI